MSTSRFQSGKSKVVLEFNDEKARRTLVTFADEDAKNRAKRVQRFAKEEAPKGKTRHLSQNINIRQSREATGRYSSGYDVSADTDYAIFVHEGTRPHKITGNPLLAFAWPAAGLNPAIFHSVNHPGTKPNRFLARAIRRAR